MKIRVFSKEGIKRFLEKRKDLTNDLFISINSWTHWDGQYTEPSPIPENLINNKTLILYFDDVTVPSLIRPLINGFGSRSTYKSFSSDDALSIKHFIEQKVTKEIEYINVHCSAGISRSGAVATVLNEYFNKIIEDNQSNYEWMYLNGCERQIFPNPLVLQILRKELGIIPNETTDINKK